MKKIIIKKTIFKILLFALTFCFTLPIVSNNGIKVFAAQSGEVVLNGSIYSEEAEYYQCCLNRLGYTDYDNNYLDIDGCFGDKSKSSLMKFLESEGYSYFNTAAKSELMTKAESTTNDYFNSGFNSGSNKLSPTAFLYSNVSNINNSHDPFYSMSVLKNFKYIITTKPTEMSFKSKRVIEVIKTETKVYGYVNLGPNNPYDSKNKWQQSNLSKVKEEIDSIAVAGWYGVFIDQFGYDWSETRKRQNIIVDYIHKKGLVVMVNAWFVDDALGSIKNETANPNGVSSHLNSKDWFLVESFFTDGSSYRGDPNYIEKFLKIKQYKDSMKINVATLSYKRKSTSWGQAKNDIKISYVLAQCLGFNGWWFGKTENSDNLLYGNAPGFDLGTVTKPLEHVSGIKYVSETENYLVEYYARSVPVLKLIAKPE